jgi:hypothetical protein
MPAVGRAQHKVFLQHKLSIGKDPKEYLLRVLVLRRLDRWGSLGEISKFGNAAYKPHATCEVQVPSSGSWPLGCLPPATRKCMQSPMQINPCKMRQRPCWLDMHASMLSLSTPLALHIHCHASGCTGQAPYLPATAQLPANGTCPPPALPSPLRDVLEGQQRGVKTRMAAAKPSSTYK